MKAPGKPKNEAERLQRLKALGILDTPASQELDELVQLAAAVCQMPIALVSLVDENRQWFKARYGLDATETPRDVSFCGHAVEAGEELLVEDARKDDRFRENPLVTGDPNVAAYFGMPLTTSDGVTLGTLCAIDTQPRKLSETQLRQLRLLASQALRCIERTDNLHTNDQFFTLAVDMMCVVGFDGTFRLLNPRWAATLGYELDEMIGKPLIDFVHDEDVANTLAQTGRITDEAKSRSFENRYRCKDGHYVWLHWTAAPDADREMIYAIARDVTVQKRAEAMKDEFISTVSHELRTPLTSIRGGLGLVCGGATGDVPDAAMNMLKLAHRNSERLVILINDILDVEKLSSGAISFQMRPVNLVELCSDAVEANRAYGDGYDVTLVFEANEGDPTVVGDDGRLRQVMDNLISNAIKFSEAKGQVEVKVEIGRGEGTVLVRDHGTGIPEDFRSRVFERFAQADSSSTKRRGGTGLGLSIAKTIVERHHGQLSFETADGVGTTFVMKLPRSSPSARTPLPVVLADVLICEDDPDVSLLIRTMLEREGIRAHEARTLADARRLMANGAYRAMTVDVRMPDGNGIELIQEVRARMATSDMPIIVISVDVDQSTEDLTGGTLNIVDWIEKPIDEARFQRAVSAALDAGASRILHVEDDPDIATLVQTMVSPFAHTVRTGRLSQARQLLETNDFDLVILDIGLTDGNGLDLLPDLNKHCPETPVVVFTARQLSAADARRVDAAVLKSGTDGAALVSAVKGLIKRARGS